MANLIITIISIGLVAVAAIMGAYYGGTAFIQGQAKAYANTAVTQGDQIAAAWSVYAAQNGGGFNNISDVSTLSSSPTYLASIPVPPPQVANTSVSSATSVDWAGDTSPYAGIWHMANLSATGTAPTVGGGQNGVYFRLTDDTNGLNTCTYVAQIAAGSSASPTSTATSTGVLVTASTTRKFDCVVIGAAVTTSTPKYIYYRAF